MKLYIDTRDSKNTIVEIDSQRIVSSSFEKSQKLLILIEQLLKEKGSHPSNITEIEVEIGPGSFTGIKVGVTVANILAWSLKIPVNGKTAVEPIYE